MTLRLLIILVVGLLPSSIKAQYVEQTLVVYHHDGTMQYVAIEQVDSITYSHYDAQGQWCATVATQLVHTPDTILRMPVAEVDSMKVLPLPSYCPDSHHPHAIDLGLPGGAKWACCNIGASVPEGFGSHYAWGEVEAKDYFSKDNYLYGRNDRWTSEYGCDYLGGDISQTEYDVAYVKWGEPWCMPSRYDCLDLMYNCEYKAVNYRGVQGMVFTGTNGNSVFLPFAGYKIQKFHSTAGNYWTSSEHFSEYVSDYIYAYFLSMDVLPNEPEPGASMAGVVSNDKFYGRTVRAVAK